MSPSRTSISIALISSLLLVVAAAMPVHAATQEIERPPGEGLGPYRYASDQVLVKFNVPIAAPAWIEKFSADQNIQLAEFIPDVNWYVFKINDGTAVVDVLDRLRGLPGVLAVSANGGGEVAFTPNDPQYVNQWYLPRMRVNTAWDHAGGGTTGPVVIIDAGVNNHVELGNIVRANFTDASDGDRCGTWGHGTFMAGIALAFTNNSTGIAGVSYNSPVYSAKVIRDNGGKCNVLLSSWVANGINWAVNQGAKAINASFVANDSQVIHDAVDRAWNNGALVVAATGNDGRSTSTGWRLRCTSLQQPWGAPSGQAVRRVSADIHHRTTALQALTSWLRSKTSPAPPKAAGTSLGASVAPRLRRHSSRGSSA